MAFPTVQGIVEGLIAPLTVDDTAYGILLQKWQHLLYEAMNIEEADIEDETKWPYLANLLIAYLVVRDLIFNSINATVLANSGVKASTVGGGSPISPSGAVKKIETGPVNVERFDPASSAAKLYSAIFNRDGLWEDIQVQTCSLARRLEVHISGCKSEVNVPLKVIRASDYSYELQYPAIPSAVPKPSE